MKSVKVNYIYILYDPTFVSKRIYVGKTTDPYKRWREHLKPVCLKSQTFKNRWIKKLLARNVLPDMKIIYEVPPSISWEWAEIQWINFFKSCRISLTNETSGGEGIVHDEIIKEKCLLTYIKNNKVQPGKRFTRLTVIKYHENK